MNERDQQRRADARREPGLRPQDQATVVGLTAAAAVMLLASWVWRGGLTGRLMDVDRAAPRPAGFVVDVNRADWPELTLLPGIGETLAKRIAADRRRRGPYRRVEDLARVRGIGPVTVARLRPMVRCGEGE